MASCCCFFEKYLNTFCLLTNTVVVVGVYVPWWMVGCVWFFVLFWLFWLFFVLFMHFSCIFLCFCVFLCFLCNVLVFLCTYDRYDDTMRFEAIWWETSLLPHFEIRTVFEACPKKLAKNILGWTSSRKSLSFLKKHVFFTGVSFYLDFFVCTGLLFCCFLYCVFYWGLFTCVFTVLTSLFQCCLLFLIRFYWFFARCFAGSFTCCFFHWFVVPGFLTAFLTCVFYWFCCVCVEYMAIFCVRVSLFNVCSLAFDMTWSNIEQYRAV